MVQHCAQGLRPGLNPGGWTRSRPRAGVGVTCCARSARPAGAARFAPDGRQTRATAAAPSAAARGGLRTRQSAGAGSAQPFPRCHSDLRCLARSPVRGLPQSKGNFLVSRQRNNALEREGAPRSQRLRLPRGPEASQAAPAPCAFPAKGPVWVRGALPSPPSGLSLFPTLWPTTRLS